MDIRKIKNGYIITDKFGTEEIHLTLESVFAFLLLHFEGRGKFFIGDSFGDIEIHRKPNNNSKEVDPV